MPAPLRAGLVTIRSLRYLAAGTSLHPEEEDRSPAPGRSGDGGSLSCDGDFNTAGSVMFLLGVGELLEEWTHKKSVGDLARSMSP